MLYFNNEAARLTLHPAGEYVHLHWYADLHADTLRQQAMEQVRQALQAQGWQKVLATEFASSPFSVELQVWLQLDWRPRAVQAGYRYCALVQPYDLAAQMALVDIMREHTAPWPRYHRCASESAALAWLTRQPRVA